MDEYYKKFMKYVKYCPDDVPFEEKEDAKIRVGVGEQRASPYR